MYKIMESKKVSVQKKKKEEMAWRDAIVKVLEEAKAPMHYNDIAQTIIQKQYRTSLGATPHTAVHSVISKDLKDKVVNYEGRGMFILKKYEREYANGNPIEVECENSMIEAYGRFWLRDRVNWKSNVELLGNQGEHSQNVNFSEEVGIYLLHRGYEIVYVGQTVKQNLGTRLLQHTKDSLVDRWDKFSWFGFYPVNENNGKLKMSMEKTKNDITYLADTLESILIECIEPRFNNKSGSSDICVGGIV